MTWTRVADMSPRLLMMSVYDVDDTWTLVVDMTRGLCVVDICGGHVLWTCVVDTCGRVSWTRGHVSWTCVVDTCCGHVLCTCLVDTCPRTLVVDSFNGRVSLMFRPGDGVGGGGDDEPR